MRTHLPTLQEDRRRRVDRELVLVAAAAVVAVLLGWAVTRPAAKVDRLTVENPTPWELTVELGTGEPGEWTTLAVVPPGDSRTVRDVLEQGGTWALRFGVAGRDSEVVRVSRSDLRGDGWKVTVPRSAAEAFRDQGIPNTPN